MDNPERKKYLECLQSMLTKFRNYNPGLTKQEELNLLNRLDHWAFLYGDKLQERIIGMLKQEFYEGVGGKHVNEF